MSTIKISSVLTKAAHVTFVAAIALIIINIFFAFHLDSLSHWVFRVFGTGEQNILTWLSSTFLVYCALMLVSIGMEEKQREEQSAPIWHRWVELSIIFFLLSLDEVAELHEGMNVILTESYGLGGYFYFAWVIPGAFFALAIFIRSLGLLRTLPPVIRKRMLYSGALYLSGAIGIEAVGANYSFHSGQVQDLTFQLLCTLEEGLEILGLWFFFSTLVMYFDAAGSIRSPEDVPDRARAPWSLLMIELGRAMALGFALIICADLFSPFLVKLDPTRIPGLIEAEWLPQMEPVNCHTERVRLQQTVSEGKISRNSLLKLVPLGPGAKQSFSLDVPQPGEYRLEIYMARHQSFGQVEILLNGKTLKNINLYSPSQKVLPTGPIELGVVGMGATNTLTLMLLNSRMQYVFDGIQLTPVEGE